MTAIAGRPGRPGIFWRDEFSGFLEAINKRDYMSGMTETLTKLYDGKPLKRLLRKETIEITDPLLILLCGGIRGRVHDLFTYEQVLSGFIPRFIFIQGETDMSRFKPLGPATAGDDDARDAMLSELTGLHERYNTEMKLKMGTQIVDHPAEFAVELTPEAWRRFNEFDQDMLNFAMASPDSDAYMPTFDRLGKSGLKAAMLMAASRQDPHKQKNRVIVEVEDILRAIHYVERWREYSMDILDNIGKSLTEKRVEFVWRTIRKHNNGIKRSRIMQLCRLTAREADWVLDTLEQRAMIRRRRQGRGEVITPVKISEKK